MAALPSSFEELMSQAHAFHELCDRQRNAEMYALQRMMLARQRDEHIKSLYMLYAELYEKRLTEPEEKKRQQIQHELNDIRAELTALGAPLAAVPARSWQPGGDECRPQCV